MNNKKLDKLTQDKMYNALFSYAGSCHIENINEEIDKTEDVHNPGQKELDDKVEKLIKSYNRRLNCEKFTKNAKRISQRAAIIVVCIIAVSAVLISSVDALRVRFLNLFIDTGEEYSKIKVTDNSNLQNQNENMKILSESEDLKNCYVPEEFLVQKIIKQVDTVTILFKTSDSKSLVFEQSSDLKKDYMIDTENAVKERVTVQGQEAVIVEKDNTEILFWNNGEKVFNLYGQISKEEILKIAESLYQKK